MSPRRSRRPKRSKRSKRSSFKRGPKLNTFRSSPPQTSEREGIRGTRTEFRVYWNLGQQIVFVSHDPVPPNVQEYFNELVEHLKATDRNPQEQVNVEDVKLIRYDHMTRQDVTRAMERVTEKFPTYEKYEIPSRDESWVRFHVKLKPSPRLSGL